MFNMTLRAPLLFDVRVSMKPKAGLDPLLKISVIVAAQALLVGHPFASVVTPLTIQRTV